MTLPLQLLLNLLEEGSRLLDFLNCGDHREHDSQIMAGAGAQQRSQLNLEQAWLIEAHANRPPAQERIVFVAQIHVGKGLIAADIQCAHYDGSTFHGFQDRLVGGILLFFVWGRQAVEVEKFRPEQADSFSAQRKTGLRLLDGGDIGDHFDAPAIKREGRFLGCCQVRFGACGLPSLSLQKSIQDALARIDQHLTFPAVQEAGFAANQLQDLLTNADHSGKAERFGEDRRMRGRTSFSRAKPKHQGLVKSDRL